MYELEETFAEKGPGDKIPYATKQAVKRTRPNKPVSKGQAEDGQTIEAGAPGPGPGTLGPGGTRFSPFSIPPPNFSPAPPGPGTRPGAPTTPRAGGGRGGGGMEGWMGIFFRGGGGRGWVGG